MLFIELWKLIDRCITAVFECTIKNVLYFIIKSIWEWKLTEEQSVLYI